MAFALLNLEIEPMATPRPRARAIRAASGKSFVSIYNPAEYTKWKDKAVQLLLSHGISKAWDKPVDVEVIFHCTQPKSTKLDAPKPDIDNYIKGFLDALTQAEWWTDDTLVHTIKAQKVWAPKGHPGSIHFFIKEIVK